MRMSWERCNRPVLKADWAQVVVATLGKLQSLVCVYMSGGGGRAKREEEGLGIMHAVSLQLVSFLHLDFVISVSLHSHVLSICQNSLLKWQLDLLP